MLNLLLRLDWLRGRFGLYWNLLWLYLLLSLLLAWILICSQVFSEYSDAFSWFLLLLRARECWRYLVLILRKVLLVTFRVLKWQEVNYSFLAECTNNDSKVPLSQVVLGIKNVTDSRMLQGDGLSYDVVCMFAANRL